MLAAGRPSSSASSRVVLETDEKNTWPDQVCVQLTALMIEEVVGTESSRDKYLEGWHYLTGEPFDEAPGVEHFVPLTR